MSCGIYIIKNVFNNKIYIGSSTRVEQRHYEHVYLLKNNKHHSITLQRAFNKQNGKGFIFGIVEYTTADALIKKEQFYLDQYKSYISQIGYNICEKAGTNLGFKHSKKSKEKMSLQRKGIPKTEEHKTKIAVANSKPKTPTQRKNMGKHLKGKTISSEHKEKIKLSLTGKSKTLEHRSKLHNANAKRAKIYKCKTCGNNYTNTFGHKSKAFCIKCKINYLNKFTQVLRQ